MERQFTNTEILQNMVSFNTFTRDAILKDLNENQEFFNNKVNTLIDIHFNENVYLIKDLESAYISLLSRLIGIIKDEMLLAKNTKLYSSIKPSVSDTLEIGAIVVASWGYEQTNVNFYCVVAETEKMVTLLPMSSDYTAKGNMQGTSVADNLDFSETTIRCKKNTWLKVSDHKRAKLWSGKAEYQSSYA